MTRPKPKALQPVINVGQPKELNAYFVYEHQIDAMARGAAAALSFNLALFLFGVSASAFLTLFSIPPDSDRGFYAVLIIATLTLLAGLVLVAVWWPTRRAVERLVTEIKSQLPPNPVAQNDPTPAGGPPPP